MVSRKAALTVARVVVCVAALWIVLRGVSLGELQSTLLTSDKKLLLLAVALYFPVVLPQAYRLFWLLRAQGIHVGYLEALKVSLAGNFLNFATPFGSNAGDLFKAYFVSLHTTQKTEAVTTVILDRFVGLATLLMIAGGITLLSPAGSRLAVVRPYILTMLTIGVVALVVYRLPFARRLLARESLTRWPLIEQVRRIDQAVHKFTGHVWAIIAAVAMTAFLQALALSAFFVIARAVGMRAELENMPEYFAYFYTGTIISALPGPPQGLGTVELAYRFFFEPFGSPSQIICMAFAIRLTGLVCSLPGLLVTMTGAYRPRVQSTALAEAAEPVQVPGLDAP